MTPALPEELSDLRLLVPRSETSPDPRFVYTTLDGKLYRFDHWAIRGHDDLGLPFPPRGANDE